MYAAEHALPACRHLHRHNELNTRCTSDVGMQNPASAAATLMRMAEVCRCVQECLQIARSGEEAVEERLKQQSRNCMALYQQIGATDENRYEHVYRREPRSIDTCFTNRHDLLTLSCEQAYSVSQQ